MIYKNSKLLDALRVAFIYLVLILIAILLAGPFIWLASVSVRSGGDVYRLIPQEVAFTFDNFKHVWEVTNLGRAYINSIIVAVLMIGGNILLASLAAYPLARFKFRGRNIVLFFVLSTLMVPFQLTMIPLYDVVGWFGLHDTLLGVVVPAVVSGFGIFLLRQAYITIPRDLHESARIDGAGEFRIWWQIMFPLIKPTTATLAIFVFVFSWGNFLWPLIILHSEEKFTVPLEVQNLMGVFSADFHNLAASSVISILPVIVLFLFLQRYFIEGIMAGSLKN